MTAVDRAEDIKARLRADMTLTFDQHGEQVGDNLLDALVQDAMFQIEHLLAEMEKNDE